MNSALFDWDDANVLHLARHDVSPEEAEEVMLGDPLDLGFDEASGEDRWSYVGQTSTGRILRIVVTDRGKRVRVLAAFEPGKTQKMVFLSRQAGHKWTP
jgi:uncharacterized DUF497 family protein